MQCDERNATLAKTPPLQLLLFKSPKLKSRHQALQIEEINRDDKGQCDMLKSAVISSYKVVVHIVQT
jgi:hypothetical protein